MQPTQASLWLKNRRNELRREVGSVQPSLSGYRTRWFTVWVQPSRGSWESIAT